jgi:hypothetical protein
MAIQIRSIGANRDVVSASLSASVGGGSPAKMTVVTLTSSDDGSYTDSIGSVAGIPFNGQLVSYSRRYEQGKRLLTREYIDNSVSLDQKCIVLFRRGLGSKAFVVSKAVNVPYANVSYDRGRVNFNFGARQINVSVQRFGGNAAGGLGDEEWSSNPCESSNVTYRASQALSIIGAPGIGGASSLKCSYEGTHRSVLSSICSDLGVGYWWDWRGGGIKIFSQSVGFGVPTNGCGILSSELGATRIGVSSQSSWAFSRWPGLLTSEGTSSITSNDYFDVSPVKHPNYPTIDQILEEACPALKIHNALANKNFADLGYKVFANINISTVGLDPKFAKRLYEKYNFSTEKSFRDSLYEYLNIQGEGDFYLAVQLPSSSPRAEYTSELYYPYDDVKDNNFTAGNEFTFKKLEISYNPSPSQRGKNIYSSTYEDQNGLIRRGHWRSVSHYVDGDKDAPDFDLAVEDCVKTVPHDVICDIFDNKVLPAGDEEVTSRPITLSSFGQGEESVFLSEGQKLRDQMENQGKVIIFVKRPRYPISIAIDSAQINPNDVTETYDYVDPNDIPEPQPLDDKPEIKDPCADIVPNLLNSNLNLEINDGIIDGPKLTSGIKSAYGSQYIIRCNGKEIKIVFPSETDLRVVRTTKAEYFVSRRQGTAGATNSWYFAGGISSNYGLSHSVVVTDITPSENEVVSEYTVPAPIGGVQRIKWLKTAQAECDGFFLPIVPGLESLSATLDSRGLRVSYSYKEIPAIPKSIRGINSIKRTNTSVTLS